MQKVDKKKLIAFSVIILIVLGIFSYFRGCAGDTKYDYKYDKVDYGVVKKTVSVTGKLEVVNSQRVLCEISGIVKKVYFDFNDNVKKGQLLVTIDSPKIDEAIIKYRDNLENSKLKLMAAERKYLAAKKMIKENLIPKEQLRQTEITYRSLKISRKHSLMSYNDILKQKKNTKIYAPITGIILSKNVEENIMITGGRSILVIVPNLNKMRLIINIDEADIGQVKNGQKVTFSVSAFPEKTFHGKIVQVRMNPVTKGGIVTYESIAECNNDELLLKPGMTATASVLVAEKKNVLRVVNQAFIVTPKNVDFIPEGKYLWINDKQSFKSFPLKRIKVKIGLDGDMYTEIVDKLNKDDEVLTQIMETN